ARVVPDLRRADGDRPPPARQAPRAGRPRGRTAGGAGVMRVLVDGRVIQDRYHGIGRYTLELLRAVPQAADVEWVVLTAGRDGRLSPRELARRPDVRLVPAPGP